MGYDLNFNWNGVSAPHFGDSISAINSAADIFNTNADKFNNTASKIRNYQQEQATAQLFRDATAATDVYDINSLNKWIAEHAGDQAYANASAEAFNLLNSAYRDMVNTGIATANSRLAKQAAAPYQMLVNAAYDAPSAKARNDILVDYAIHKLDPRLLNNADDFKLADTAKFATNDANIANINSQIKSRSIADAGTALRNKQAQYSFDRHQKANEIARYLQANGLYDPKNPENTNAYLKDVARKFPGTEVRQLMFFY